MRFSNYPKRKAGKPEYRPGKRTGCPIPLSVRPSFAKLAESILHRAEGRGVAWVRIDTPKLLAFKVAMEHERYARNPKYLVDYVNVGRDVQYLVIWNRRYFYSEAC